MKRLVSLLTAFLICFSFINILPSARAALLGDVTGNGKVTTNDALLALKIAAMQVSATKAEKTAADYDGNGVVTTEDVRLILHAISGVEVDYEKYLRDSGFPESYIKPLLELHEKYPEWVFSPFITGLEWSDVVKGERTPHSQQLISGDVKASFKCRCSSCNGVIQEAGGWVSASEEAVSYYLDPRNFLTERYIFQFESTAYDSEQTTEAVETIIRNTWMHNSNITYLDATGTTRTYTENGSPVKYSTAIMRAAKDSGMSAYYLASKIVQEVGSSTSSYAGGSSGKCSPYYGIYNYYNIGAYTGALDGLKYANGNMKASKSANIYKTASTATTLGTVSSGTPLYYMGTSGNYYKVNSSVGVGYIAKTSVSMATSYGRPWDNPYKTIYYGAQYIQKSFGETQFTGYLQKFNVNPESDTLYEHEYMANVRAAASESSHTYDAYVACGLLSAKRVLSIPVFKNMPDDTSTGNTSGSTSGSTSTTTPAVTAPSTPSSLTVTAKGSSYVSLKWNTVDCDTYYLYRSHLLSNGFEYLGRTTSDTFKDEKLIPGVSYTYKIRACNISGGNYAYSGYSNTAKGTTTGTSLTKIGIVDVQDSLNFRETPSMNGEIITTLPKGQKVFVVSTEDGWHRIKCFVGGDAQEGYVSAEYIDLGEESTVQDCPYTEPTANVSVGSSGNDASWVQWYLAKLGYLSESGVDGAFGSGTESAVIKFQEDSNLDADGIVGSATRKALIDAYNK